MFETILVPLDGSEAAAAALPFARLLPATRYLLLRVEAALDPVIRELAGLNAKVWRNAEESAALADLDRAAATFPGETVEPLVIFAADPADAILDTAVDADLIVMGTHGRGAAGRLLRGAVTDRVARHATVPVLVVRSDTQPVATPRLVVPLDGSPLAEEALTIALALGSALNSPLHLIRVVDDEDVQQLRHAWQAANREPHPGDEADAREACQSQAESYLAEVAARLAARGLPVASETLTGNPGTELVGAVTPEDIVVMRSHGRGGIRRWLIGSVAERLVREGPAPVLLVPSPIPPPG